MMSRWNEKTAGSCSSGVGTPSSGCKKIMCSHSISSSTKASQHGYRERTFERVRKGCRDPIDHDEVDLDSSDKAHVEGFVQTPVEGAARQRGSEPAVLSGKKEFTVGSGAWG
jgi:hypothetical protein